MNLLLIQSDIQLNTSIAKFLELKQINVTKVYDKTAAINHIDNKDFNLYIIDFNMNYFNGLDIIARIRRNFKESLIIVITEYHSGHNIYEDNYTKLMTKPFYLEKLKTNIDELLNS